jgi:hypothetical protein
MIGAWSFLVAAAAIVLVLWQPAFVRRRWLLLVTLAVVGFWLNQARSEFGLAADATTYVAAGERLLRHGDIYAMRAGDRPVLWGTPYIPAPSLYPPPAALAATPLALLGDAGVWLVWLLHGAVTLWVVYDAYRHGLAILAVALLPFVAVQLVVGNINGVVAAATILAWRHRDSALAGVALGLLGAVKIVPLAVVGFWVITRRWRPAAYAVGAAILATGVTLAVVGPAPFEEWVHISLSVAPAPTSIQALGVPWPIVLAIGLGALFVARSDERVAYAVSVLVSMFVTPAFNFTTTVLFLAAAAPFGHRPGEATPNAPGLGRNPRAHDRSDWAGADRSDAGGAEP